MKKLAVSILTIVVIFCMQFGGSMANATNIDEATARQLGTYYLSVMTGKEAKPSQITLAYQYMNPQQNIPAAYIFNVEEQGFVIVSGSDLWYPILGFSTEGELNVDNMAPSFKYFLDGLCQYIIYSQNTDIALIEDIQQEWDELIYQKLPEMANPKAQYWLLNNSWGQGDSYDPTYNKLCPQMTIGGVTQTSYVGCVATAMAQIMHYWKYPKQGDGWMGYTCNNREENHNFGYVSVDFLEEGHYQYDLMPEKLTSSSPEEQIDATALLNYHAGVSVRMTYGIEGSGAFSTDVPGALKKYFKYDKSAKYVNRSTPHYSSMTQTPIYSNDEWVALLKNEIDAKRPIHYGGYSPSGSGRDAGGHAFVCDGYHPSNNNKFHFNWGWDGQPNSWYDVRNNMLNPMDYNFFFAQDANIGITPPADSVLAITAPVNPTNLLPAYPNPAITNVVIPYELGSENATMMNIYSIDGRFIESVRLMPNENSVSVDVSRYPQGMYVYKVGAKARKFVVQ